MYGYFIDRLKAASLDVYAMEIYFRGETVFHYDIEDDRRYPVYSVTKSITSAAFSLACGDGLLTADTPLYQLLPKKYSTKMSEALRAVPFKRFITMTAGQYPFRPYGDDWLETVLLLDTDHSNAAFHYSNIPAYLVGVAVENTVGMPLIKYLDRRLFEPLNIPEPPFSVSPEGYFYGATGMSLTVAQLARLGRLYLQNGQWNGEMIIDPELIKEAITPHVSTGKEDSYGYFFRVAEDHYSMVGKWGQRCMIYPKHGLVIAYLSHQPEYSDMLYDAVRDFAKSITAENISR